MTSANVFIMDLPNLHDADPSVVEYMLSQWVYALWFRDPFLETDVVEELQIEYNLHETEIEDISAILLNVLERSGFNLRPFRDQRYDLAGVTCSIDRKLISVRLVWE